MGRNSASIRILLPLLPLCLLLSLYYEVSGGCTGTGTTSVSIPVSFSITIIINIIIIIIIIIIAPAAAAAAATTTTATMDSNGLNNQCGRLGSP